MEQRFIVNPFKCMAGLASSIGLLAAAACMLPIQRLGSGAVFFSLSIFFCIIAVQNGAMIHLSGTGVKKTVFGFKTKEILWSGVGEIGVIGTKIFNRNHPEKTGSLYIYVSETSLADEERFTMSLKWPPSDKIYLVYNSKRISAFAALSDQKVQTYNVGNLVL